MYTICVRESFSAAHYLNDYYGKCENMHGHNYLVELFMKGTELQKNGIFIDFTLAKKRLKELLYTLDHNVLNEISFFSKHNPTSEHIAYFIFTEMSNEFPVSSVRVWETDKQFAEYSKE